MKMGIKAIGIIACIMIAFATPVFAASGEEVVFNEAFCEALNPDPDRLFCLAQLVYLDGIFYGYLGEAIYTWQPGDAQPVQYCSLPPIPEWKETWRSTGYNDISVNDQTALSGAVDYIAAGDDVLWGYNMRSGRIGKITEQGVIWMSQPLDTSCMYSDDSAMALVHPIQSWVEGGKLYIFGDHEKRLHLIDEPMVLLRYDISSGEYEVIKTKMAINCCLYKSGFLLLLRRGNSSSMILSSMDIETGAIVDLPPKVPFPDRTDEALESIGGLAYDLKNDQIFFSMKSQVWKSEGGLPFESVARLPRQTHYRILAWILPDDRYATFATALNIRVVN